MRAVTGAIFQKLWIVLKTLEFSGLLDFRSVAKTNSRCCWVGPGGLRSNAELMLSPCTAVIFLSLLIDAKAQHIYSEQNSPRLEKLANGNLVLRESHSDGGSLIPGRSWGKKFLCSFIADNFIF